MEKSIVNAGDDQEALDLVYSQLADRIADPLKARNQEEQVDEEDEDDSDDDVKPNP